MGIAGGSVTDWRDYDSIYTERYILMPQNNPDGYARTAIQAITAGDTQRTMLAALRRFLKVTPVDTVAARRRLADATTEQKKYVFG